MRKTGYRLLPSSPFGLVGHFALLSTLLVVATALGVALVTVQLVSQQVEQASDRRLRDGAAFFQGTIDTVRADLAGIGRWLADDQALRAALQDRRADAIGDRLALAIRLHAVDEVLVADASGSVVSQLQTDGPIGPPGGIGESAGFRQAMAGRQAYGIGRGQAGFLQQEVYFPVRPPGGEQPIGVLRLASFLNDEDLAVFKSDSGLDASLFFGQTRLATTLRRGDGRPLADVGADPVAAEVTGQGGSVFAWRRLPIGWVRTYSVPLEGPEGRTRARDLSTPDPRADAVPLDATDGGRIGVLSLALPVNTMTEELRHALLAALPVTLLIVLVGASFAYLIARRVRAPVLLLATAAAGLREGDLSTSIPPVREPTLAPLAEQLELARRSVQARVDAVAREETRQRALLAALHQPILTTATDDRLTAHNAAAVELFGETACRPGRAVRDLLPFVGPPLEQANAPVTWQGRIVDARGGARDVEVTATRLAEGQLPASVVYAVHDVSRHAELSRQREQLLHNVAHELRSPLALLDNALEIIGAEYAELTARDFDKLVRSAQRTVARLRGLMEDLLNAGSIQAGRFTVRPRPTELADILDDALESVEQQIEARNQRVDRALDGGSLAVLADRRYARQVLVNLLTNASKYSPDRAVIRVHAARESRQVRVVVEDCGPGIPAGEQAGLFERFYQVPRAEAGAGVGLGLAIARGIVEAHGGAIGLESAVGVGTRVWFTMPVAEGRTS